MFGEKEMFIKAEAKKWGNSLGIVIPKEAVKKLGIKKGQQMDIEIKAKKKIDGFGIAKGAKPFEEEAIDHEF